MIELSSFMKPFIYLLCLTLGGGLIACSDPELQKAAPTQSQSPPLASTKEELPLPVIPEKEIHFPPPLVTTDKDEIDYNPTPAPFFLPSVKQAQAFKKSCSIDDAGLLHCEGVLQNSEKVPAHLQNLPFLEVAVGKDICAIDHTHTAHCFGENAFGQSNVPADLGPVKTLSTGTHHSCAIRLKDFTPACWGGGFWSLGGLWYTDFGQSHIPLALANEPFLSIAVGNFHTCGILMKDNTPVCWSQESWFTNYGQAQVPLELQTEKFAEISTSQFFSCGRTLDGKGYCWGSNRYGELYVPNESGPFLKIETQKDKGGACAETHDHQILCWGDQLQLPYVLTAAALGLTGTAAFAALLPTLLFGG